MTSHVKPRSSCLEGMTHYLPIFTHMKSQGVGKQDKLRNLEIYKWKQLRIIKGPDG